jgi:exodeoxyribonuclease (lambda-induced)
MSFTISKHAHGTEGWTLDRLGKITASTSDKIITKTGKLSSQSSDLVSRAVAEVILGRPDISFQSFAMERGLDLESEALEYFNFTGNHNFKACGFVNSGLGYGCSPDGIDLEKSIGLELKCPEAHTHLAYLASSEMPDKYKMQVQFSLWVTGFESWVFGSYHPELPGFEITVERDEKLIAALAKEVPKCVSQIDEMVIKLREIMEIAA